MLALGCEFRLLMNGFRALHRLPLTRLTLQDTRATVDTTVALQLLGYECDVPARIQPRDISNLWLPTYWMSRRKTSAI